MARGVRQTKSGKFELCVRHKLLSKPFIHLFSTEDEADAYGTQLRALLDAYFGQRDRPFRSIVTDVPRAEVGVISAT